MGIEDIDELETRRNGSRPPLQPDATHEEMVAAINDLAKASRSHSIELAGIRVAVQELGTRIGTFCERIEKALVDKGGGNAAV